MIPEGKIILVVIDSLGVGELPDSWKFDDVGTNTLANTARFLSGISLSNFEKLGMGSIIEIDGIESVKEPIGCFGKMAEKSAGKDTISGHWEIAGYIKTSPFPTYPDGFPGEVIKRLEKETGREFIGNKPASGTEIIVELGEQHIQEKKPIVYTSVDSVFQVAAHLDVIPLNELYDISIAARKILKGEHEVGRVIARPFRGEYPDFERTRERRDFSIPPSGTTILDILDDYKIPVKAVGKIDQIFAGRGISESVHINDDIDGIEKTIAFAEGMKSGLVFTNLIDLDMIYGHRNNPRGYADSLKKIDSRLPDLIRCIEDNDLMILTADHGCDPTTRGTDHTREYVPLLVYGPKFKKGVNLGTRENFADIANTIADFFQISTELPGRSFYPEIV